MPNIMGTLARCDLVIVMAIAANGSFACSESCTTEFRGACARYTVVDDATGTPICDATAVRDDGSAVPCVTDAGRKPCEYSIAVNDDHWHFTVSRDGYSPRTVSAPLDDCHIRYFPEQMELRLVHR
jgi:hypothetical protein